MFVNASLYDADCCHMGSGYSYREHSAPDRVKPSFVIFDIQAH